MSNVTDRLEQLNPLQRAVFALKELRAQHDALERERTEPIAIIGISCRFPGGVQSAEDFWRLLRDGVDATTEVPADRWDLATWYDPTPGTPGKMCTRRGAFIDNLELFDPLFFGMAPREALSLDPQQRLLLELAWEALEDACLPPERLAGTAAGVFVGICPNEYSRRINLAAIDAHSLTGNAVSVAAGRLAYVLGWHGPVVALDTACSSSLVAVHLACQSLHAGECRLALAGGVNLTLDPGSTVALSEMRALSPEGRCKAFDASADGFVRGEGCGLVVLKRLSAALADGDRVLALIRGSAVNHDGRSASLTAPSRPAQEAVLRAALQAGKVDPLQVQYVEAHGTGTPLGDPIEVAALAAVYGPARASDQPLLLGSVKTNVGHLEAAAGIAGLIKVVLALRHGQVPPSLHFRNPNPHIAWDNLPLAVVQKLTNWPGEGPRLAAVSSFGFSGTNAHIVLEAAPAQPLPPPAPDRPMHILALSARDDGALRATARRLERHLVDHPDECLADVCYTLNIGRATFDLRAVLLADSLPRLRSCLAAVAEGREEPGVLRGNGRANVQLQGTNGSAARRPALDCPPDEWIHYLNDLGRRFVAGETVDWADLDAGLNHRKLSLPGYCFQRQHYWLPRETSGPRLPFVLTVNETPGHLLGQRLSSALKQIVFETWFSSDKFPFLADHCVHQRVVVAGACHLALVLAAAGEHFGPTGCALADVVFPRALVLPHAGCRVQVILTPDSAGMAFQVFGCRSQSEAVETWEEHASGRLTAEPGQTAADVEFGDLDRNCSESLPAEAFYKMIGAHGVDLGPGFRWIEDLKRGSNEALCRMRLPCSAAEEKTAPLHPGLADSCVQMVVAAASNSLRIAASEGPFIPVGCERLWFAGRAVHPLSAHAQLRPESAGQDQFTGDVRLFDATGNVVARWSGLRFQRAPRNAFLSEQEVSGHLLYQIRWRPQERTVGNSFPSGRWLLDTDSAAFGDRLAQRLDEGGAACLCALPQATDVDSLSGVIFAWGLDTAADSEPTSEELATAQQRSGEALLTLLQRLSRRAAPAPRLWIVTRATQAAGGTTPTPLAVAGSFLWGLARVIALEHPEYRCSCVDLDSTAEPTEGQALLAEIAADGPEDQISLRGGNRYVARLERMAPAKPLVVPAGPSYRLEVGAKGDLASLRLNPAERRAPLDHEVQIQVRATGLNFRDVLNALDMYPGEAGPLGLECAGVVSAVGAGVTHLAIGDEVVGMAADSFAGFVATDARLAERKPACLSFEEAATIPVVFLTSHYGLNHLARLQPGERVLIHAAAGGVGLSALQLAQRVGAEVIATAGSPAKRAYLKSMGVRHVFDSRDLRFAEQVRTATDGAGVHVVLNSLAGAFIPASLDLLVPGGRFLEIGKTDIWDAARVHESRPDVAYYTIALDQMGLNDPAFVGGLLRELLPAFAGGTLKPLPRQVFSLTQAPAAFRFMAQARHTGKIVLTPPTPGAGRLRADGTYLITGGLGALGLHVARRLAEQGAGHLVLVGRRAPSTKVIAEITALESLGARVTLLQADISQDASHKVLTERLAELPALRGVVHAAGVLDDGVLLDQTRSRLAGVLAPKAWGAWNLHRWTRHQPLDFFVLFSSAAALLGSPGQANYAAANAFLDALAHHRHALGLPAVSIAWGPWAGSGMAANLDERERARWEARGLGMIVPETGMALLDQVLASEEPHVAVLPIDWNRYLKPFGAAVPPLLSGLVQTATFAERTQVLAQLRQTPTGRRREALVHFLRTEATRVLGLAPDHPLGDDRPLQELGLDSLLAVELRNVVGAALERTLPATVLFNYPSIQALAGWLETELFGSPLAEKVADHVERKAEEEITALSEAELDDLLAGFAGKHLEGADE